MINEILAHGGDGSPDFIELYNYSLEPVDVSGAFLSDRPATNKFRIPENTVLPPRGTLSFTSAELGFALNASGEAIYFVNPDQTRVLDAISFEGQALGRSSGRYPDGAPAFRTLRLPTPGTPNSLLWQPEVVINEIMYQPISGQTRDEYVELFNTSSNALWLDGWKLSDALSFTVPASTLIPAGGYLVIATHAAQLLASYPQLNPGNTLGNYSGTLGDSGERLVLTRPEQQVTTNAVTQVVSTNSFFVTLDEVRYGQGGRWGKWANGGGSSLELKDHRGDRTLAGNWADSDESGKSDWTTIEFTGALDNGSGSADSLEIILLGEGECVLDNVQVLSGTNLNNLVTNPTFDLDAKGWAFQGNHDQSGQDPGAGVDGSGGLRIRASGRGDTGANRIRTTLKSSVSLSQPATNSLHLIFTTPASSTAFFYEDTMPITTNAIHTLSFWYLPGNGGSNLTARLGSSLRPTVSIKPNVPLATPGNVNTIADTLTPYPPLWLNEVQPEAAGTPADQTGVAAPWVELFNPGTSAVSLADCYLSSDYVHLDRWPFPADAVVQPGQQHAHPARSRQPALQGLVRAL